MCGTPLREKSTMKVANSTQAVRSTDNLSLSKYRAYSQAQLDDIPQLAQLSTEDRAIIKAIRAVLPFRANSYVIDQLIDWSAIPNDPIYQLVFPQRGMLDPGDLARMVDLICRDAPATDIEQAAHDIRQRLNPHPA